MLLSTHPSRSVPRRFCLDACLSYRVIENVDNLSHVSLLPELQDYVSTPGQCSASDRKIAEVCGASQLVLVTCDSDFRRLIRGKTLVDEGLEVILFTYELEGLKTQIRTVTRLLPRWHQRLSHPYGANLWLQYRRGGLQRA